MNILQVCSSFPPAYAYGGATKVVYDLSRELVARGHDVTVFTTDVLDRTSRHTAPAGPETMDGIRVFRFRNLSNTLAGHNFTCAPGLAGALRREIGAFDLVHLHEYRSFQAMAVRHYAVQQRTPYLLSAHGAVLPFFAMRGLKRFFDKVYGDRILRDAALLLALSAAEEDQYRKMGIPGLKIDQVPNGIDLSEYETLPARGAFRARYGIRPDQPVVLYLGRIHPIKGIGFLVDAFSLTTGAFPAARLVIAGPDDGHRASLEAQVARLGLDDRVTFTGPLFGAAKREAMVDADLVVYPSVFEIFGLVPLEAIMCGTPVIVTDSCGCGNAVRKSGCGRLVKYGDTGELARTMGDMLAGDPDREARVRAGREYIGANFSWGPLVTRLEAIYEDCVRDV
jgi:glycosyltransferase involved in cell wall biosynthesis